MIPASVSLITSSVEYVSSKEFSNLQYTVSVPSFWGLWNDLNVRALLGFNTATDCFFRNK